MRQLLCRRVSLLTRVLVASLARSHVRATLGDPSSKFSLYPAPVTNCRCGATIPCDGTICGGRRFAEAEGAAEADSATLVIMPWFVRTPRRGSVADACPAAQE